MHAYNCTHEAIRLASILCVWFRVGWPWTHHVYGRSSYIIEDETEFTVKSTGISYDSLKNSSIHSGYVTGSVDGGIYSKLIMVLNIRGQTQKQQLLLSMLFCGVNAYCVLDTHVEGEKTTHSTQTRGSCCCFLRSSFYIWMHICTRTVLYDDVEKMLHVNNTQSAVSHTNTKSFTTTNMPRRSYMIRIQITRHL